VLKAVIFDIDGTLVDSVDFHAQSWERTFQHFNHQIPYEQIRPQIGKGSDQLMPVFFSFEELNKSDDGSSPTKGERMRDYRRELYKREYHPRIKAFSMVRELFQRVKADGKRIALASSATKDDLAIYKQIMNVEDLVDVATTTSETKSSKPEPDIFKVTLDKLGDIAPSEAIVVGDTPYDAEAAGKLNLPTIGVLCGGFPPENLLKAGCIAIYQDPADLLAHYDESPLGNPNYGGFKSDRSK
jgi:HAD superfamily hydrolase (TIGR01509 family)